MLAFLSMVDRRKKLHRELTESLPATLPAVADTPIPSASVVELMGVRRAPVVATLPSSPAAKAYVALWERVRDDARRAAVVARDPALEQEARVRLGQLAAAQARDAGRARGGGALRERVRAVAAVAVGGQHVGVAVADQLDGTGTRLGALAAEQRAHVDLQQRARGELVAQHPVPAAEEPERALGVPDQQPEALVADVGAGGEERLVDARERDLEQDPARAGRAVGDDVELVRAERRRAAGEDLPAGCSCRSMPAASSAAWSACVRSGIVATSSGNHGWPMCGVTVAS